MAILITSAKQWRITLACHGKGHGREIDQGKCLVICPGILALLKGKLLMLVYKGAFFHTETKTLSAQKECFWHHIPTYLQ